MDCSTSLPFTVSWSLLKFISFESVILTKHFILYCPLLLIFPSIIRVFSSELAFCIRWPKYWSFSFSISPPMNIQGCFPLGLIGLILQSKGLSRERFLQCHSSKTSLLWHSAFLMVQFSYLYLTTGKPKFWIYGPLLAKWCLCFQLFFNILIRFVIVFLPRSKHLWILWLQSLRTLILEPNKIKSVTASTFSPSNYHEVRWDQMHDISFCFLVLLLMLNSPSSYR